MNITICPQLLSPRRTIFGAALITNLQKVTLNTIKAAQTMASAYRDRLDYSRLDFDAFMRWKKYRLRKDGQLIHQLVDAIKEEVGAEHRGEVRILDIGAGDGGLCFTALKTALAETGSTDKVSVTCVEPVAKAAHNMSLHLRDLPDKVQVENVYVTIQDFLKQAGDRRYDLILCTHTLYHIPQNEWTDLFARLFDTLNSAGKIIVVMAPRSAAAYEPLHDTELSAETPRLFSEYGLDLFAEDFLEFIEQHQWAARVHECDGPIHFTPEEIEEFQKRLGNAADNTVLRTFSFLYRLPVSCVEQLMVPKIKQLVSRHVLPGGGASIPLGDICITLTKPHRS